MNPYLPASVAVVAAYLIGAVPFGYLVALGFRGVDIRTVGSGNIGATNVGRVLGFRFFVLVFVLDLLKGFLPTYGFPRMIAEMTGRPVPELAVLVALATILGHNFPVYLKFRGGKGVATSLGAVMALDMVASVSAAVAFTIFLIITRFVSVSSLGGGLVFMVVHFSEVDDLWGRDQIAMSLLTFGLVILLFVRHRKNLGRLRAGTEPKVSFRKKRSPDGFIAWRSMVALAVIAAGLVYGVSVHAKRRSELVVGSYRLSEVARVRTGHQRAERIAFADNGKVLAVTCPRYDRVVLYGVSDDRTLSEIVDIELSGRPVSVCATRDRFLVLVRPSGDRRHVEPGWWEAFDFRGNPIGSKQPAGMYPDDLAVTPDGIHLLVLNSGRAEGDARRPIPALETIDLNAIPPRRVGRLEFDQPRDDPCRLVLSESGTRAAVTLLGSGKLAAVDLSDLERPREIGRTDLVAREAPRLSTERDDRILTALAPERDAVVIPWPKGELASAGLVASTRPRETNLLFHDATTQKALGQLPLHGGALNLSVTRPVALAYAPERALLAVANRSGGIHLFAIAPAVETPTAKRGLVVNDRGRNYDSAATD